MPYGGNDWLALTQEATLEPEIPICDPHHHFWDFRAERVPYQRYLLHELVADVGAGHNLRSTVKPVRVRYALWAGLGRSNGWKRPRGIHRSMIPG